MEQTSSAPTSGPAPHARARQLVAAAVVVGLVLRLAFALGYWVGKPLTLDEQEYLALARNIAHGRGFTYAGPGGSEPARRHPGRAPLYPAFLAAILSIPGVDSAERPSSVVAGVADAATPAPAPIPPRAMAAVKIAQAIMGALGVWLVGALAARAAGAIAGAAAAALAAVYPPLVWICAYVLSESLYSVLALCSALLLDMALARGTTRRRRFAAAAGVVAGLATLTRPAMIVFVVIAALFLLARRRTTLAAVLVAGSLVAIGPWTIRNARAYDRFVLVASEGGVTFWTGNNPLARGEGDLAANPDIKKAYLAIEARYPDLTAEQLEPIYYREGLTYISGQPLAWLGLLGRKAFYAVVPVGPSYRLHSTRYYLASLVSYGAILPFAIAGFIKLRGQSTSPVSLWLLAASAVLVALAFFPQERFRIPVIDPTLIVCAAAWLALRPSMVAGAEAAR